MTVLQGTSSSITFLYFLHKESISKIKIIDAYKDAVDKGFETSARTLKFSPQTRLTALSPYPPPPFSALLSSLSVAACDICLSHRRFKADHAAARVRGHDFFFVLFINIRVEMSCFFLWGNNVILNQHQYDIVRYILKLLITSGYLKVKYVQIMIRHIWRSMYMLLSNDFKDILNKMKIRFYTNAFWKNLSGQQIFETGTLKKKKKKVHWRLNNWST